MIVEKGPTAGLVYVEESDETDASGMPRITFHFIRFVNEQSDWRVDGEISIGSPASHDDGSPIHFDIADLPSTFQVDGQVREAPRPEAAAEVIALLDVFSYGYSAVVVVVNGIPQGEPVTASRSGLVVGGLRKGSNDITVQLARTSDDTVFVPRVTVRQVLSGAAI